MTVSTSTSRWEYDGNDATTVFAYTGKIFAAADLVVHIIDADGNATLQTLNTDYTVSGAGATAGGSITFNTAPATGETVLIRRVLSLVQSTSVKNQGAFYPEIHEDAFDRMVMVDQQQQDQLDRTFRLNPLDPNDGDLGYLPTKADRANRFLSFDDNGDPTTTTLNTEEIINAGAAAEAGAESAAASEAIATEKADIASAAAEAATMTVERFSGDDATVAFTLPRSVHENNTQVYIDGVYQQKNTYSISGVTLTFAEAPPTGADNIEVVLGATNAMLSGDTSAINYSQGGAGSVTRGLAAKLRDFVNVKDFGVVGDGVTDDTTKLSNALASGVPVYAGNDLTIMTDNITVSAKCAFICDGVIKARSAAGIAEAVINLSATADGSFLRISKIDMNGIGRSGIKCAADDCNIDVYVTNLTGAADSGTSTAALWCTGNDNQIVVKGRDILRGASPSDAFPRVLTFDTGASLNRAVVIGRDVNGGVADGATCVDNIVEFLDLDGGADNGIYTLGGSKGFLCKGGRIKGFEDEPFVIQGSYSTIQDLDLIDCGLPGFSNCSDFVMDNVTQYKRDGTARSCVLRARSDNTSSSRITIRNCKADILMDAIGVFAFGTGTVNDARVYNNDFRIHWDAGSTGKALVSHTTGDLIDYRSNRISVKDDSGTLTGGDIFTITLPAALSRRSQWIDNTLVSEDGTFTVRVVNAIQTNLLVRSDAAQLNIGPYLIEEDFTSQRKDIRSTAAPTTGTWQVGDIVWNTAPAAGGTLGWVCVTAGTPGTWKTFGTIAA